jgi:N-acyl-L-homoserine lactone synthetase
MHVPLERYHATIVRESRNPQLVASLLRLRWKLFVEECGWELASRGGLERDEFDTGLTEHCLLFRGHKLIGGFRAIRTDRPYLSASIFPQLASFKPYPQRPDVWEISRFGVLPVARRLEAARVNYALMFRFAELRLATALVATADLPYERFLASLGIRSRRFGVPQAIGSDREGCDIIAVAGEIPISGQDDRRYHTLKILSDKLEVEDAAHVLGRALISA